MVSCRALMGGAVSKTKVLTNSKPRRCLMGGIPQLVTGRRSHNRGKSRKSAVKETFGWRVFAVKSLAHSHDDTRKEHLSLLFKICLTAMQEENHTQSKRGVVLRKWIVLHTQFVGLGKTSGWMCSILYVLFVSELYANHKHLLCNVELHFWLGFSVYKYV